MFNLTSAKNTNADRPISVTRTGEFNQPTRLYYHITKQKTVLGVFNKLRCVQYNKFLQCWRWIYDGEAQKIRFDVPYQKIPKEYRPIVLGDIYFPSATEMIIDVRSFQRATEAILFFDRRINRRVARIERLRVVNQLFDGSHPDTTEILTPPFDHFFENRDDIYIPNIAKMEADLEEISKQYRDDPEQRDTALTAYLEANTPTQSPLIEELPTNFYEDGIGRLHMALMMRMVEAKARWDGNTSITKADILGEFADWLIDEMGGESAFEDDEDEDEMAIAAEESTVDVASVAVTEEE